MFGGVFELLSFSCRRPELRSIYITTACSGIGWLSWVHAFADAPVQRGALTQRHTYNCRQEDLKCWIQLIEHLRSV